MSEKRCSKCGETKPLEEFHRRRRSRDGLYTWCKVCTSEYGRAWYKANPDRATETRHAWYEANRERVMEQSRAWRKANPERAAAAARAWAQANPEKRAEVTARQRAKYPERDAARGVVRSAVKRGDFPPPSALVCDCCQEAQAQQYHHYLGYEPEHALDVIPVCITCHVELDKG